MSGWEKREVSELTILGDGEGHVKKTGGLLASIRPDTRFPENNRYELVLKSGESAYVPGSAAINSQLGPADVGRFVKMEFLGWGNSPNGKFKKIDVLVYMDEPSEEMKSWPRFAELHSNGNEPPVGEAPIEDDSMPF